MVQKNLIQKQKYNEKNNAPVHMALSQKQLIANKRILGSSFRRIHQISLHATRSIPNEVKENIFLICERDKRKNDRIVEEGDK